MSLSHEIALPKGALLLSLCIGCAVNPITGDEELMLYPEDKDLAIGRKYAPKVEKALGGKIDNEELQTYIDRVGQRIARFSHRPDLQYHFVAVNEDAVNALALPGGYIYVLKGMLKELRSEAQLAALLGHEVAHVVARDSAAALSRMQVFDLLLYASIIADAPGSAVSAAQYTRFFLALRYSREDEREADLTGLDYMVAAGYDPGGVLELMQTLEQESTVRPLEFFSTHPSPKNRISYLTREVQRKYRGRKDLKIGKDEYQTMVLRHISRRRPS